MLQGLRTACDIGAKRLQSLYVQLQNTRTLDTLQRGAVQKGQLWPARWLHVRVALTSALRSMYHSIRDTHNIFVVSCSTQSCYTYYTILAVKLCSTYIIVIKLH